MSGKERRLWGEDYTAINKKYNKIFTIISITSTVQYIFYSIDIIYTKKVFKFEKHKKNAGYKTI